MFTPDYRARIREALIQKARQDTRIESAAAVGGSAQGQPDRWSDLDLSFGVSDGARDEVLADWTASLRSDFDAVTLFDLPFMSSLYRVFLFPGALQVDLSFTPSEEFGALGPRFALLFGTAVERPQPAMTSPRQEFGLAAHHAVRAHFALRLARVWQAEHWMSLVRDHALTERIGGVPMPVTGADTLLLTAVVFLILRSLEGHPPVAPLTASPTGIP